MAEMRFVKKKKKKKKKEKEMICKTRIKRMWESYRTQEKEDKKPYLVSSEGRRLLSTEWSKLLSNTVDKRALIGPASGANKRSRGRPTKVIRSENQTHSSLRKTSVRHE